MNIGLNERKEIAMKEIFSGQTVLSVSVMVLLMLSLLCQLFLVYYMTALAKEAKELYKVSPKRLKPWIEEYLNENDAELTT